MGLVVAGDFTTGTTSVELTTTVVEPTTTTTQPTTTVPPTAPTTAATTTTIIPETTTHDVTVITTQEGAVAQTYLFTLSVSCAKTAERIEMMFRTWTCVGLRKKE